jgi:hypothetical protein
MTPNEAKAIAETAALVCAGLFFGYKFLSGYLLMNLSLSVTTCRHMRNETTDILVVALKLTKGDRGSTDLHDAKVRVSCTGGETISEVVGADRRTFQTQKLGNSDRRVIDFSSRSAKVPLIRLTPGEETTFSAHFEVPRELICTVEAAVLGSRPRWPAIRWLFDERIGQWRASVVSPPDRKRMSVDGILATKDA